MEKITDKILKFLRLDTLVSNLSGYVEARVELVKIEIREEVAATLSRGLLLMLLFMVGFMCMLFSMLGLALYLNTVLESSFAGYLLVAGFFALVLLILIVGRKSLFRAWEKQFVQMIKQRQH